MFKVDTIIYIFALLIRLLQSTANKQDTLAAKHQETIDNASAAKRAALSERGRAEAIAAKIAALIA